MAFNVINAATAKLAANATKSGRQVIVIPRENFGDLIDAGEAINLGLLPPDAKIDITTDIQRTTVYAQNPEGGPDLLLEEDVTQVSAIYEDISILTPDDLVRSLHVGAVPSALAGDLEGGTISPFAPGASISASLIVVRQHPGANADRLFKVYWHPRVGLQSAGEGDSQGKETLKFRAPIQAFDTALVVNPALQAYKPKIGSMGAIFTIPASKLDTLVNLLIAAEAATVET